MMPAFVVVGDAVVEAASTRVEEAAADVVVVTLVTNWLASTR